MPRKAGNPDAAKSLLNHVNGWLMKQALLDTDIESIVIGCCERLFATGMPLVRGFFAFPVLHPLHSAIGITWLRGKGATLDGYPHVPGGVSDQFMRSPHYYMLQRKLDMLRVRLSDRRKQLDFPILEDLSAEGVTDYVAFVSGMQQTKSYEGMFGSWSTDRTRGFTEDQIEALLRVQDRLAVACKLAIRSQLMRNIADTYLGTSASAHVLEGQIKRGDGQAIEAAIWYCDLRGSTVMADTLPPQDYIDNLNSFFDATGGAITAAGGEILSFVGDGLLAIFPTAGDGRRGLIAAVRRARRAVHEAVTRMDQLNVSREDNRLEPLRYGIALHAGKVLYGNVGVRERLTFSAFGAAVNEVARLEELTKELDEQILVSDRFAELSGGGCRLLGTHTLRGVGRQMGVHALEAPRGRGANGRGKRRRAAKVQQPGNVSSGRRAT
ncbi:MAG: adenylate/guanylate cyclase domain-containing protein [Pseudomonadota bacterium]|nr:adenylate/guanylate cyclase domain-containing protein [Pseudomonadota bacterium]